jgi:hypothetical protein
MPVVFIWFKEIISEDDIKSELNWLKYNKTPWTEVIQKWKATSAYRVSSLREGTTNLDAFKLFLDDKADSLVSFIRIVCRIILYNINLAIFNYMYVSVAF